MILRNNVHKTTVQVNLRGRQHLSAYQVRTAWKVLCGRKGCPCCCGSAGQAPLQQVLNGEVVHLVLLPGGEMIIVRQNDEESG